MEDTQRIVFAVLGPLEVRGDGQMIQLSGRHRGLLGVLLMNANSIVARHDLVCALWREPPRSAVSNLQTYVAGLRRTLAGALAEAAVLETRAASRITRSPQQDVPVSDA